MISQIKYSLKYIKYWLFAKHKKGHGIHSPFVYNFIVDVLNNKKVDANLIKVFNIHDKYKHLNQTIEFDEIGAGSNYRLKKKKNIGMLVKRSSVNKKYGKLLFDLVQYFEPKDILEIGSSIGISSSYIAQAANQANFKSIEGIIEKLEIATQVSRNLGQNTEFIHGNFDNVLDSILKKYNKLDFVFFDGNHTKQGTISYFNACLNKIQNETIFLFDDIHWSEGMEEAWNEIKRHDKVTVSIDLFRMGLIFFKKELSKQEYVIKF